MNFPLYIATRYLFAKKSRKAINIISAVSVAGVTVGTMALIIILSVFNGLEDLINNIFNVFDPDLRITVVEGKTFTPDSTKLLSIGSIPGISAYSLTLEENSLLEYDERQYIATIRGVDENYSKVTFVESTITDGEYQLISPGGRPQAVVGAGVANYLGLNINFITPIHIYVPRRTAGIDVNPENAFIDKYIFPSGIFQIDQEFDSKYIFVPIEFARELLEYQTEVSAIDIRIEPGYNIATIQKAVKEIAGNNFEVKNRFEQKEIFYKVMKSERLAIFVILTLILIIASFNIIGSLTMLIIEKRKDINILRSLGADDVLIKKIFLLEGWLISIIGTIAGVILGFIICRIQQKWGIVKFNSETLMVSAYPVVLKIKDFLAVPITVLIIGFFAALYPVRYLSKKYLSKGIHHEKKFYIKKTVSLILLIFVLLGTSCGDDGNKVKKSRIIPPNKLVSLLTDLYISDGLLSYPPIKQKFEMKDSIMNYIDVINSHGYTKEDLDHTIKYYFEKDLGKLEKIYDQVLANLVKIQSQLETEEIRNLNSNLWNQKLTFSIPEDGNYNKIEFDIPLQGQGTYCFKFNAIVYPDDQSVNLRTNIFFWHADSTESGVREYWTPNYYISDGIPHDYSISQTLTDTLFTHIRGCLLEHDPQSGRWKKHVRISGIRLIKEPVE